MTDYEKIQKMSEEEFEEWLEEKMEEWIEEIAEKDCGLKGR